MFELSEKPLDTTALRQTMIPEPSAGALVVFEGGVSDHTEGQAVTSLTYEATEKLCRSEAEKIFAEAVAKFGVTKVRAAHRVGHLQVGEVAVWIGVTAAHRDAAFAACRYVIDELKQRLPIWKKEQAAHGNARWIGA